MVAPKKKVPKLGPKKNDNASTATPQSTPRSSNAGLQRTTTPTTRPSPSPAQLATSVQKRKPPKLPSRQSSEASMASSQARKPSKTPRRPSGLGRKPTGADQEQQKPPKLLSRQSSGLPSSGTETRKPSVAPRKPSNLGRQSTRTTPQRRPPKLPPKKTSSAAPAQPQPQKPSATPKPKQALDVKKERAAHKVDEEQQDLKSILSDEQCEDLVRLTASITNQMRRTIEDNFSATATLEKIGQGNEGEDNFASLDFDPGTVDVAVYDKEKKLRDERQKELATPKVKELKKAALKWFDDWRTGFLGRVDETVNPGKTTSLQLAQKEGTGKSSLAVARPVQTVRASAKNGEYTSPKLEQLFPRVSTSLTKMPMARRSLVLHSLLLLLLSLEHYNAASRVFLLYLASSLKIGLKILRDDEEKTAKGLLEAAKQISASKADLEKGKESEESRRWKMRLATVAGAAIVGLSGGYAAPMIAASVGAMMSEMGLGASAAAGYLGTVAGNTYLVGSLFGAYGGRMTGEMMRNLSADVQDFAFLPVHGERKEHEDSVDAATDTRRLRVIIAFSGWLLEKEEVVTPWRVLKPSAEVFALRFELETLMSLGQSINTMSASDAYGYAQSAFTQRAMVTDLTSAIWPVALVKVARVVENPFSLAKARADKAGKVLADALISHTQGERPVTLIGYSMGARVIWSCLATLAERRAFGLVESVVILGAPIPSDIGTWRSMRTAVSGRLVNVFSKNDYLLAFLYRTTGFQYGVAGLMPISGLSGVENFDVSETVTSHLRYRYLIGSILQKIGFEDVDKDEVAKEAEAFKIMTEEEPKHDYVEEVKQSAEELYRLYAKRGKLPPNKKISDKDADQQASAMEKEVQQKTQKGLMQWAVEQLYISPPTAPSAEDVEKAKSDPTAATKGTTKSASKTADAATKSMYQRAKEAVYISRSGGSEGRDAAKGRIAEAQSTASSAAPSSYLATAAGYIPTSYIPGFGAGGNAAVKTNKAVGKVPKQVSKPKEKEREVGKAVESGTNKTDKAKDSAQATLKRGKSISAGKKFEKATEDPADATAGATKRSGDAPGEESPQAAKYAQESLKGASQSATNAAGDIGKNAKATSGNAANEAPATGGYTNYLPSFGYGSSSKSTKPSEPKNTAKTSDANKPTNATEKVSSEGEQAKTDSTDTTPTKATEAKGNDAEKAKASSYGSYIHSFGFAGSSSTQSSKPPAEAPDVKNAEAGGEKEATVNIEEGAKDGQKEAIDESTQDGDEVQNLEAADTQEDAKGKQKEDTEDNQEETSETQKEATTDTENEDPYKKKKGLEDPFVD